MTIYKGLPYLETALLFRDHTRFLGHKWDIMNCNFWAVRCDCSMHEARWTVWRGCQQVPKQPHDPEVAGSDSFTISSENHQANQCLQRRWIQRVWALHLSDKLLPDPRLFCHDLLINDDCAFMHIKSSRERPGWLENNKQTIYSNWATLQLQKRITEQSQNQAMNARNGKNMPGSWSLQFTRCFILPTAFFVLMSENSKIIQSEKSQMSQWYRIIAFFFSLQCRKNFFSVAHTT